jgi:uncharacterized protein Yka (UPF0111/DUF47 family)
MKLPRAWFLPETYDILGTLIEQLATVNTAIETVQSWCAGSDGDDTCTRLRAVLVAEYAIRRRLHVQVRTSFSTPLPAEDLFELGERLGETAERAYLVVREAELSHLAPDANLRRQVDAIADAMTSVATAVRALPAEEAAALADDALDHLIRAEHAYREAVGNLDDEPDVRREIRRRELYRQGDLLAEAVRRVARRTWYTVFKSQ